MSNESKVITREQYMENIPSFQDKDASLKAHREYYAQFVTQGLRDYVVSVIGAETIAASKDRHLNDIPLHRWDRMQPRVLQLVNKTAWKEAHGSLSFSLSDTVCLAKEAAQQIRDARS